MERDKGKCMKSRSNKLLHVRELCGKVIASRKGKLNFQMEFLKKQASYPQQVVTVKVPLLSATHLRESVCEDNFVRSSFLTKEAHVNYPVMAIPSKIHLPLASVVVARLSGNSSYGNMPHLLLISKWF
ncbi:hypothetical protein MTR67_001820 [Solanum verrucosum]|uniref:Uncharacterized protein n=1 Tax=Solanum verrucosum TaxID=315347 RepID=A0AAF0PR90_SOLVR|nr:hypothetical protein MTR67_001820 [Solanum verrucosum]